MIKVYKPLFDGVVKSEKMSYVGSFFSTVY